MFCKAINVTCFVSLCFLCAFFVEIFLKNVFTQLCSEAVAVSQNQTVSVILEKLIAESDGDYLVDLLRVFSKDWEIVCHDRFASHVLQSLLMKLAVLGSFDEKHEKNNTAVSLLLDIYTYLVNNIAFNMQATYASHLVRVILEIVGGVTVSDQIIRSKVARQESKILHCLFVIFKNILSISSFALGSCKFVISVLLK